MERRWHARLVVVAVCCVGACSGGPGPELGDPVDPPPTTTGSATSESTSESTTVESSTAPTDPTVSDTGHDGSGDDTAGAAETAGGAPTTTASSSRPPESTSAPIETVPADGVPGIESDDRFCAAWARFGGTWQVLIVGSQFLDDPERVARWEVAAAPVLVDAYGELAATFPDQLADERDAVLGQYFGALLRRSEVAAGALADAGATTDELAVLAERWLDALGTRSDDSPAVELTVPDELEPLVAEAAAALRGQRVPIHTDPSMFVTVETPATDLYIDDTCPDRGTLSGLEVDP